TPSRRLHRPRDAARRAPRRRSLRARREPEEAVRLLVLGRNHGGTGTPSRHSRRLIPAALNAFDAYRGAGSVDPAGTGGTGDEIRDHERGHTEPHPRHDVKKAVTGEGGNKPPESEDTQQRRHTEHTPHVAPLRAHTD